MARPTLAGRLRDMDERRDEMTHALLKLVPALSIGTAEAVSMLAGGSANDRQNIKRKAERWRRKFEGIQTDLERIAILRAILQACMEDETLIPDVTAITIA